MIELKTSHENLPGLQTLLAKLDAQTKITYHENASKQVARIYTLQPAVVIELLSPWLNTDLIHNMEVRNQTLEDVYVNIIQSEEK